MRAIVQKVQKASVLVDNQLISQIGNGLCVLIGISRDDKQEDCDYIVRKLLNLRVFDSSDGKRWHCSVSEKSYEILCVSQFTLLSTLKGNKLDFHRAMDACNSKLFYSEFISKLKNSYQSELIKDGVFGEYMNINIVNDGPVTVILDSQSRD